MPNMLEEIYNFIGRPYLVALMRQACVCRLYGMYCG